jgi:hypothetical protein
MLRIICFAVFGLLVSSEAAFSQGRHSVRPRVRWHPGIVHRHDYYPRHHYFDAFRYFVQDFTTAYTAPEPIVPFAPTYFFLASESPRRPQLILKNDTTYTVADYWRVDDQLHFITVEEGGTKSVPHTVPFGDLDVQRTTAAAVAQGFRFVLRDEPIDQWLQHHAQHKPAAPKQRRRQRSD